MAWMLLAGLAFAVVLRLARRRPAAFTMLPSGSSSTIHVRLSKKQTGKKKAGLEAATAALRN
jgi:hypothetical protein